MQGEYLRRVGHPNPMEDIGLVADEPTVLALREETREGLGGLGVLLEVLLVGARGLLALAEDVA